jgi:mycofactocin precursor
MGAKVTFFSQPVVKLLFRNRIRLTKPYPMENKEKQRVKDGEEKEQECENVQEPEQQDPDILEEIEIEEFAVDGICGVY